jgi:hypothetical protein
VATPVPAETRVSAPEPAAAAATPAPAETARPVATPPPAAPAPTAAPTQGPAEKTVAAVREAVVDPVVQALPTPVASPVQGVLDQVQATGKAVDGVLGGLQHKP